MSHYPDQYEKFSSELNPLCSICRDSAKESLSKVKGEGWVCDDCAADLELSGRTIPSWPDVRIINVKDNVKKPDFTSYINERSAKNAKSN